MNDPIFGRMRHQLEGVPVQDVSVGLKLASASTALGVDNAFFIYLNGCRYCETFSEAWNAATTATSR